jgi:hypothetical protein
MRRSVGWIGLLLLVLVGCSTKPATVSKDASDKRNEDPWPRSVDQLKRDNDLSASRKILEQLRIDLVGNSDPKFQPVGLTAEQEKTLQQLVNLNDKELREIRPATYTTLDAQYLAECYYLRDVVRSLGLVGLPPAQQAELAYDWVRRQILLNPWFATMNGQRQLMPPAPPSMVMLRGAGSGLERAYVFLGLLQQLDLDAGLVGPAEAVNRPWTYKSDANPKTIPTGPFTAVGVRIGKQILYFDTFRDKDAIIANPNVPTPATSTLFLCPPLSSLAPRFQRFELELKNDTQPIQLYVDLPVTLARMKAEVPAAPVAVWNPVADSYTATRTLVNFIPPTEGGFCPLPELPGMFRRDLIPLDIFAAPTNLRPRAGTATEAGDPGVPEVVDRLRMMSAQSFVTTFIESPTPRERIHRGQFAEVTPILVKKRSDYLAGLERLRTDRGKLENLTPWLTKAREVYVKLLRDRDKAGADSQLVAQDMQEIDAFWKSDPVVVSSFLDTMVSEAGAAESTYLLALCRHEQAERAHLAFTRLKTEGKAAAVLERAATKSRAEWQEARGWWQRYDDYAATQNRVFPGRAMQAQELKELIDRKLSELPAR